LVKKIEHYTRPMTKMRLTFVLPQLYDRHIGGYKVPYQSANWLARNGHRVTLVHPITDRSRPTFVDVARLFKARARQALTGKPPISWFDFEPSVRSVLIRTLSSRKLPKADITILTAWQTAEQTRDPAPQAGVLAQLVHDYEFWMTDAAMSDRISSALGRADVHQIATSNVVVAMLGEFGREPVATINAGLLDGEFGIDTPIEGREKIVIFQSRLELAKDFPTALSAATRIVSQDTNVQVHCFGDQINEALPLGITSLGRISDSELRALYNRASVFFSSSRYEGWGLPMAEAMACGAAVVSTRCGGVEDFLIDDANGLLVPIEDPTTLADGVLRLLRDDETRVRLATQGSQDAVSMSVERSCHKLESLLNFLLTKSDNPTD
jgi:glycosyltransferase involved in cell wall biosynthesis